MSAVVCSCGHVLRLHTGSGGCWASGCRCTSFTRAADPDAATEAARVRQADLSRLLNVARRALARGHWREAEGACAALSQLDTHTTTKETR